jgi:formamidopyrimidine-DNA glycosylase
VPELIEAELYRVAAARCVGRTIARVELGDPPHVRGGLTPRGLVRAVRGTTITGADRHGKVVLLRLSSGRTLALRFGMTGRLVVDDAAPIERLEYGPAGVRPEWVRLTLGFVEGGSLVLVDPRRLGWIEVDPDLSRLGPDAASISRAALRDALGTSTSPLKARLLDQSRVAGIGNLIVDETLFRAGLDPARPAGSLGDDDLALLRRELRATIRRLSRRGGSHTGELQVHRQPGASCPRCGVLLQRRTIGGRTTYSCPQHQT